MSSGGKGGKSEQKSEIPQYIQDASKASINRANSLADVGYMPWYGPDVAAVNPLEEQAFSGAGAAMDAFGLGSSGVSGMYGGGGAPTDVMAGMPQAQTFANGQRGYSSAPLFLQALQTGQQQNPEQASLFNALYKAPTQGSGPPIMNANGTPTYPMQSAPQVAAVPQQAQQAQQTQSGGLPPDVSDWIARFATTNYFG